MYHFASRVFPALFWIKIKRIIFAFLFYFQKSSSFELNRRKSINSPESRHFPFKTKMPRQKLHEMILRFSILRWACSKLIFLDGELKIDFAKKRCFAVLEILGFESWNRFSAIIRFLTRFLTFFYFRGNDKFLSWLEKSQISACRKFN